MEQVIYSRLEFPTEESTDSIFNRLSHLQPVYNDNSMQIGGISIGVRCNIVRAAILLTYDEESDNYVKLGYSAIPGAIYTNLRK